MAALLAGALALAAGNPKPYAATDTGQTLTAPGDRHAGAVIQSGAPRQFTLPGVQVPTLYTGDYGFIIAVPQGATKLEITLQPPSAAINMDLYVRFAADPSVANGQAVADFRSEGVPGENTIFIDPAGWASTSEARKTTPVLQTGNYHIAFGLRTLNIPVTATVTATVTGGSGGTQPPPAAPSVNLTGTWNWTAACANGPFSGQLQIQQTGAALSGSFLGSEPGTINGTVQANQFTFTRTWTQGTQTWSGTANVAISGSITLQGQITGTNPPTQCTFSAVPGQASGGGGGGGGGAVTSCSSNSLTNPSFETPGNVGVYRTIPVGDAFLTGWTVTEGSIDAVGTEWKASDGVVAVDVNALVPGRFGQAFATTSGRQYLVTFDMAGNPAGAPAVKRLRVIAAGQSQDYEFDVTGKTGTAMGWTRKTFTFTANAATATLEFMSLTSGAYGPGVDNVAACDAATGAGTGGGSGGGTSTGALTVTINQEDNSLCPAQKKLIASVTDSQGLPVTGLGTSNFTLTENGRPVTIASVVCSTGGGAGASGSIAILIDRSGSLSTQGLADEKSAAKQLVDAVGTSDSVAIYSFGSDVTLHQDFTTNKTAAKAAVDAVPAGGNTQLYQAIIDAATRLAGRSGRRAIVVMTDGENSAGTKTVTDAINAAKSAQTPVFTVGFDDGINETILTQIANETGGTFSRGATSGALQQILTRIGQVLTSQCEIIYVPAAPSASATVVLTASVTPAGGAARTGSTTRTVAACTSTGGGGGSGGGSTTQPGCDYFVRPLEYTFGQAGGTAGGSAPPGTTFNPPVLITTRPECRWGSLSNDAWISVEAGQSGQGDGAVSYRVAANATAAARTGTLTIAGRTHTVRQAAGSTCSYTISPTAATVSSSGGFGTVDVTATQADCVWTATTQSDFLSLNGGQKTAAGTGSGRVRWAAGVNVAPASRTGTVVVAGRTFTVTQNAAGTTGDPTVPENGVVPAGSGTPPSLPGGALAQGSFFTVFAYDVGPADPQQATTYPLPTNLGGTEVILQQGSTEVRAYVVFTSRSQVNGIAPSNTPLGDVDLIVAYGGKRSKPVRIRVVRNNFNIFTTRAGSGPGIITNFVSATNQPLNTRDTPATPRQVVTIWGNGGGPIAAPDNVAPPVGNLPFDFEVIIGGKPQNKLYYGRSSCCSALDQVVIELSPDVPLGCTVPVQVRSGGSSAPWSNVATMAISADGSPCTDPSNPASALPAKGGRIGAVLLMQGNALMPLQAGATPDRVRADLGLATFVEMAPGGALGFNPLASLPPVGSCQAGAGNQDLSGLLGGALPTTGLGSGARQLDAGTQLTITNAAGRAVPIPKSDSTAATGPYLGLLGGSLPFPGMTPAAAFLEPGAFRLAGTGGKDVGAFTVNVTFPTPVTWSNRDQLTSLNRAQGATIEWTGGAADDRVLIIGGASDQKTQAGSGFLCIAAASAQRFVIPPSVLSNLPATRTTALSDSVGLLGVGSLSLGGLTPFSASGLDTGLVIPGSLNIRTLDVQ